MIINYKDGSIRNGLKFARFYFSEKFKWPWVYSDLILQFQKISVTFNLEIPESQLLKGVIFCEFALHAKLNPWQN